jgi:hypothetical protein
MIVPDMIHEFITWEHGTTRLPSSGPKWFQVMRPEVFPETGFADPFPSAATLWSLFAKFPELRHYASLIGMLLRLGKLGALRVLGWSPLIIAGLRCYLQSYTESICFRRKSAFAWGASTDLCNDLRSTSRDVLVLWMQGFS